VRVPAHRAWLPSKSYLLTGICACLLVGPVPPPRADESVAVGLRADGVNRNQGAESTLSWLLSLMIMHEMHPGEPQDHDAPID